MRRGQRNERPIMQVQHPNTLCEQNDRKTGGEKTEHICLYSPQWMQSVIPNERNEYKDYENEYCVLRYKENRHIQEGPFSEKAVDLVEQCRIERVNGIH